MVPVHEDDGKTARPMTAEQEQEAEFARIDAEYAEKERLKAEAEERYRLKKEAEQSMREQEEEYARLEAEYAEKERLEAEAEERYQRKKRVEQVEREREAVLKEQERLGKLAEHRHEQVESENADGAKQRHANIEEQQLSALPSQNR